MKWDHVVIIASGPISNSLSYTKGGRRKGTNELELPVVRLGDGVLKGLDMRVRPNKGDEGAMRRGGRW